MRYILASASPRRKELLKKTGWDFECIPSKKEEKITTDDPKEVVKQLSLQKASDIFEQIDKTGEDCVLVGADTIVVYRDEILGKPEDSDDAYNMLSMLSDRTHQVYTGVTIYVKKKGNVKKVTFYEKTDVTFYPVDQEDLKRYVASGDPLDKAGAYGIQSDFAIHIKTITGDYNNVVGLPLGRVYHTILDLLYK